jgi:tetratricopeptide (TPR) repeat protein
MSSLQTPSVPTKRPAAQIFISYSRSDRLAVDQLFEDLRKRYYVLWMDVDERGIEPGEKWRQELVKQVSASAAMIACVSPDFLRSAFCRDEVEQAKRENKHIFPVIVRRLDPDQSLANIGLDDLQFVDLTQGYSAGLKRLTSALPRPAFQLDIWWQRFNVLVFGAAVVLVILLAAVAGSLIGGNPTTPATPGATPMPTGTPTLEGDLKVVVTPFELDDLSETEQRLADNIVVEMSKDLEDRLKAEPSDGQLDIGILTSDVMPRVVGSAGAESLAAVGNYHVVVYGSVTRNSDGYLEITPRFYIPSEQFADAPEMTGDQEFGPPIVLQSSDAPTAYQTSTELQSRVEALVYVIQGVAAYTGRDYSAALALFNRAANLPNWGTQREVLYVLRGNVYLQRARDAITECNRATVLTQLERAQTQYQEALVTDEDGRALLARPYAAMAEVSMLQASWSPENEGNPCDPPQFDLDKVDEALRYSEMALDAQDYFAAVNVIRVQALFTHARAQATKQQVIDPNDPEYSQLARDITRSASDVLSVYQTDSGNETLRRVAFEAYLLRGFENMSVSGTCEESSLADFQAAIDLRGIQTSRRMFAWDFLGQCYEHRPEQSDETTAGAIAAYREAYRIAETLEGDVNRNIYGCLLIRLTGDADAAEVSAPCDTVLQ